MTFPIGGELTDQVGALRDLRQEGKIGHIGLSEVTVAELAEAREIVEVASVQNRYNVLDREHDPVLDACEAAGIAFLPWRPLPPAITMAGNDGTGTTPFAAGGVSVAAEIFAVAREVDATAAQVSLAWLLARSPVMLPIPGTANVHHLAANVAAASLHLTDDQRRRLDRIQS